MFPECRLLTSRGQHWRKDNTPGGWQLCIVGKMMSNAASQERDPGLECRLVGSSWRGVCTFFLCSPGFPLGALVSSHNKTHALYVRLGTLRPWCLTKGLASELEVVPGCWGKTGHDHLRPRVSTWSKSSHVALKWLRTSTVLSDLTLELPFNSPTSRIILLHTCRYTWRFTLWNPCTCRYNFAFTLSTPYTYRYTCRFNLLIPCTGRFTLWISCTCQYTRCILWVSCSWPV